MDTNILMRFLTGDDEQKARRALNLLTKVERGKLAKQAHLGCLKKLLEDIQIKVQPILVLFYLLLRRQYVCRQVTRLIHTPHWNDHYM